jgi:hypothetical protein
MTLKEEHRLKVFENRMMMMMMMMMMMKMMMMMILGSKRDEIIGERRELHNEELHNL